MKLSMMRVLKIPQTPVHTSLGKQGHIFLGYMSGWHRLIWRKKILGPPPCQIHTNIILCPCTICQTIFFQVSLEAEVEWRKKGWRQFSDSTWLPSSYSSPQKVFFKLEIVIQVICQHSVYWRLVKEHWEILPPISHPNPSQPPCPSPLIPLSPLTPPSPGLIPPHAWQHPSTPPITLHTTTTHMQIIPTLDEMKIHTERSISN